MQTLILISVWDIIIIVRLIPAEVAGEALLVPDAGLVGGDPFQIKDFSATLLTSRIDIVDIDVT